MFNLKKLLFNPKLLSKIFLLFLYLSFSIFCGFYLVKICINHESISKIISWLVWFLACIINTGLKWRDLTTEHLTPEIDGKTKNKLFSKQWYSENLWAIIIMIISISVMIILLAILTINGYWNTKYVVSDPKFEVINDLGSILLGIYWLCESLKEIPRFHNILNSKVANYLINIAVFSASIMFIIYSFTLTEVP